MYYVLEMSLAHQIYITNNRCIGNIPTAVVILPIVEILQVLPVADVFEGVV